MESRNSVWQKIKAIFTSHPESVGETYLEHFLFASYSGLRLTIAGIACIIHSIFPFIFISTASNAMKEINEKMAERKNKK